ncbi:MULTISPECIES: methyltransferase [Aliiglaciecola]|uniref:methyltransferase n=1 Tax=Aliiglaciecola TaxID=1406885 RepID=UPI001C0869C9|nr:MULTISPECIES: methyltransferase [Aliiglaciecola]MBU2880183.1 methyltransferase [Aliiglaciecola lipolytica]MDO6713244.1 methyltransferase [Aliiglaciecola sp. 2_MG-2023]MDO6754364.1 methyltransferase [Aliiglaciecola sp. 1_MG-2023]
MLSTTSQVLVRNKEQFAEGRWLFVNPPEADIFSALDNPNIFGFHQFYDVFQQCPKNNKHLFSAHYPVALNHNQNPEKPNSELFDGAVIYMPKSKEHAALLIANMAACVKPSGNIFLVGENKSGIKSADKLFAKVSQRINKIDSARHCSLYCAYIEEKHSFDITKFVQYKDIQVNDVVCKIAFLPGIFNTGALDPASQLLIENLPEKLTGKVLDFASGSGVIGCFAAKINPEITLTLCDVSALATYCSELSLLANNLKANVIASNGLAEISHKFNTVLTNPPFHTGIKTDYSVTDKFIKEVKFALLPKGTLMLVANRFLPYPDIIKGSLPMVSTVAQTSKFNLYRAQK